LKEDPPVKNLVSTLLLSGLAAVAVAQDHANCPMAGSQAHRAQVDERHDEATGVAHEGVVHHFALAPDGGSIRLEVTDASQGEARDRIREHLQTVARSFAAGDFSLPMRIHDQVPPGVDTMKKRKSSIRYLYSASDTGGVVRISTRDAQALDAVRAFLRFQIEDHGTNDPTE
jgi:hypothetical protein